VFDAEGKSTPVLPGTASGCINHPGIEAIARCKQCGKPVCGSCVVAAYNGNFCSPLCKEKHEKFVERAQKLDAKSRGGGRYLAKLRFFLKKLVVFLVGFVGVGFVSIYLQIPYASVFFTKVYLFISSFLPFLPPLPGS